MLGLGVGILQAQSPAELIASLERENARVKSGVPLTESDTERYAGLIAAVAALGDPRALNALMGALGTGSMATAGVAALGEIAVAPLIERLQSGPVISRNAAVRALTGAIANANPPLTPASLADVRAALLGALDDENRFVRTSAIEALDAFIDAEVRASMERLAATDPARVPDGGFPVREAAASWLARHRTAQK